MSRDYWESKACKQCPYDDTHKCIWGPSIKNCKGCCFKMWSEEGRMELPPENEREYEKFTPEDLL